MSIHSFFKPLRSTSTRRQPSRRSRLPSRPRLEALKDRCLPSFYGPVNYPAGSLPPSPPAPVQDFNGDGYMDYANPGGFVHLGNADGTFRTGQPVPLSGYVSSRG